MTTNRSDYVLVWISKDASSMQPTSYCSLCRVQYKGDHCPIRARCIKDVTSPDAFDNTKHIVIATKDFCKGRQYGCNFDCSSCTITCTYNTLTYSQP